MALFQCIQVSKGTNLGHLKGWSGIWRSRAFWGLTPKSNRARSRCDVGTQNAICGSRGHLKLKNPHK